MNIQDFNPKNRSKMVDNLMENKMIREFNEIVDETNKTFPLFESVLDPIQKYRCPTLFGENNKEDSPKMKKEAREFLLNIAEKFIKDIEIPGAKITEFFMIGSSLGYQYRADADIDCDLRINIKKEDMTGKFSLIPKGIIYPGSSQPVNIFLLCEDDAPYDFENHCENAYDLLENKWIKQGVLRNEYPIPYSYVAGVSEFIMDGIALQLQRADRHIQNVHKYISLDPEKVEISARERADAIADGINDLKIDTDALNLSHHFLFRFDGEGFNGEEFRISIDYKASRKHYTINNLIYKYVDGFGYYDKVNAKIKEIWAVIEKAENELEKNKGSADEERDQERIQDEVLKEAESVESVNDKTTVLNNLRSDIQDEYTAIKGYDAHADFAEKNGCSDIAEILRDIRDEEKVHIGELEAVMKKYDKEFKSSLADGGKEAEEVLKEDREYTRYVKGHIKNTKNGYRWLKKYLPEIFPKGFFENRKIKQAIKRHDKSKWGKEEYKTYSDFQKIRKMNLSDEEYDAKKGEFNVAWNHQQKTNKHHWQYWVLIQADGSHKVLDMPFENIIEMICDWWTFSWKDNDLMSIFTWYENNKNKMILSQNTRQKVEMILGKMKKKIQEQQKSGMLKECDELARSLEIEEIILTENKWSTDNFKTPEEIGRELERLHSEKEKHLKEDDMPSAYFENIDKSIKELNDKMQEFDCKCEKLKESPMYAKDGNIKYNPIFVRESRLPEDGSDPEYGVPEQKKYPLYDKAHVEAAIKLFGHVDAQYEQQLARAILVKMKKYGIPYTSVGEDNKLFKWIPKKYLEK